MTDVLAVVAARGGSKGVPGKNLRLIDGKPLVAYQVEAAVGAEHVDEVIVSTDDETIADAAREVGADVPFTRPADLAGDDVPVIAAFAHAAEYWREEHGTPTYTLGLQPTSPFNPSTDIDTAVEKIRETGSDSVVSVERVTETHPYRAYRLEGDRVKPLEGVTVTAAEQRQDRPDVYGFTGAIYLRQTELLFEWDGDDFALGEDVRAVVQSGRSTVEIDTDFQLELARALAAYDGPEAEFPPGVEPPSTDGAH
ncbi:acylneuraminate cytidylyltransferase family protein [Halomicroarcula sp. GCM10025817]|uniref:acylneuraminate cytidylyltransferase family protein n=1 Tax=Haloarcula TaxID=2237 RepID=UPI0023E8BC90|nr:acylneuraminate cytidylyltransferase family protein [Halomicroarcula sp. SYNS111]